MNGVVSNATHECAAREHQLPISGVVSKVDRCTKPPVTPDVILNKRRIQDRAASRGEQPSAVAINAAASVLSEPAPRDEQWSARAFDRPALAYNFGADAELEFSTNSQSATVMGEYQAAIAPPPEALARLSRKMQLATCNVPCV